ncbi:MAG: 2-oxoacid:acceptor oxidoreductase family protein [Candidatus Adiutrix sp.]|jgi:pyruvate ferredoxin oxidoreductase gamma subunit|nr:2-oxoacid:acceptor oxidoreductase family protein [Candidatus Adiutrix sp.]
MLQIVWHGRGGQGAFTAARLLGAAYALGGMKENGRTDGGEPEKYALAFPSFGPERRGAPMRAFTKLSDVLIHDRSEIARADFVVFLDETLYAGERDALVAGPDDYAIAEKFRLPVINTIMLGRLAKKIDMPAEHIAQGIRLVMPGRMHEKNMLAVREAMK